MLVAGTVAITGYRRIGQGAHFPLDPLDVVGGACLGATSAACARLVVGRD